MDLYPDITEMVIRLVLAALLGGLLGLEREWRRKPAGLRTHGFAASGLDRRVDRQHSTG